MSDLAATSDLFVSICVNCSGSAEVVLLGVTTIGGNDSHPLLVNIVERLRHPDWQLPTKYNDIALFKLERSVSFSLYVRPACLADTFAPNTERAIATGWGRMENFQQSDTMLKVVLEWFSAKECNASLEPFLNRRISHGVDDRTQICAGSRRQRKDTCQGDSGGPLQIFHPSIECMYSIVGITSFGIGCAHVGLPAVYTRVYAYIDWIERIVWSDAN